MQACGILAYCPGIKPTLPALEGEVSITELPGKSLAYLLNKIVKVLVTQSCLTLCNPMDSSPPGPLSVGFSGQEYWSGLPCPPPGDLPNPGVEPRSLALQSHFLPPEPPRSSNRRESNDNTCSSLCSIRPETKQYGHLRPIPNCRRAGKIISVFYTWRKKSSKQLGDLFKIKEPIRSSRSNANKHG